MRSPIPWIGGKSRLAQEIAGRIPDHTTYVEPFTGAGWVFFARDVPSRFEVLNDINSDLVTFYRVLQNHIEEFCRQFKWLLASREWFEDWTRQLEAGGLTDIQRAARFYYLQRMGYGGRVVRRTFGASPLRAPRVNLIRMEEELSEIHLRLAHCTIEHLQWSDVVPRYDKPDTFFYLDPPYFGCETYYGPHWNREDFSRLAEVLSGISGKFLLSLNDTEEICACFGEFKISRVQTLYSNRTGPSTRVQELLISNF